MTADLSITRQFLDSLARLSGQDQGRVRDALSKAVEDHRRGGLRLHPVGPFLSLSPTMDLRVIAWRSDTGLVLVHVNHHDAAYAWAERHAPVIGDESQLIGVADVGLSAVAVERAGDQPTVASADVRFSSLPPAIARMLAAIDDEADLLETIQSLAPELQEAALTGATVALAPGQSPSDVLVMTDDDDLRTALTMPAAAWRLFLHPKQRHLVTLPTNRHVLVRGGPGTGKSVALVHRYARLYREALIAGSPKPAFVALTPASRMVVREMLEHIGVTPPPESMLVADDLGRGESAMARSFSQYSAVIIDEGQDLPTAAIANLLALLERGADVPPLMIGFDANQAILNPTGDALGRLAVLADTTTLTYSYRSTRQVVEGAQGLLAALHGDYQGKDFKAGHMVAASRDSLSAAYVSALSGPDIAYTSTTPSGAPEAVDRILERLSRTYQPDALAVVVATDATPQARSAVKEFAQGHPGVRVLTPYDAKGREFLAGVVVDLVTYPTEGEGSVVTAAGYRALSGLYVAVTRFRDQVEVVTTSPKSPLRDRS